MRFLDLALILAVLDPSIATRVDADAQSVLTNLRVPGASVEVIRGGKVEYRHAYGYRDLREALPVQIGTHFEIGSITKQFTAAAILRLRDRGLVNLDAPVSTYLPGLPHASDVTVRECLAHTSGLPEYLDGPDEEFAKNVTFDDVMARLAGKPLDFTPGAHWSYSNTGYAILGRIIEVVSHQSYERYIRSQFLDPLGMRQTFTVADEAHVPNMAIGYHHVDGIAAPAPAISESFAFSAGDLVSTVDDLEVWSASLASGRVIPQDDYVLMSTEGKTSDGGGTGYGFGLFVDSVDDQPRIGHTGGSLGFTTADEYFQKQDVRVIAFTNDADGNPEAGEALTTAIFEDLFPSIAAQASNPAGGENHAIAAKTVAFFREMQDGTVPDTELTPHLRAKFHAGISKQLALEYAPYGSPTAFIFKGHRRDAHLDWYDYDVRFGPGVIVKFGIGLDAAGPVASLSFG